MARPKREQWSLRTITGMNITDPSISLLPGQVLQAENIDLFDGGLGRKRVGYIDVPQAGTPPTQNASTVVHLHRHVPTGADSSAELWAVVRSALGAITLHRYTAGTWVTVALADTPTTGVTGTDWSFATFNQKLFIAYDSFVNRLHVWDGMSVRRAGLAPPALAPGLASLGAGALNFTRHYRVRFRTVVGVPATFLLSEPSPSASITIAASAGVQITRPPLVDGNEQAWHLEYANTANGPWFEFAQVVVGTLTFNDTGATINTSVPSREVGLFQLPPSCKYLSIYRTQLLMAGAWETTTGGNGQTVPMNNRVWFTRPLHTFDQSDDESVPDTLTAKFWTDLSEDADQISGLSYPLEGIPYAMKVRQAWGLVPTDDLTAPFRAVRITDGVGCRDYRTLCIGEDEHGNPALYFNAIRGPYRIGRAGLQYIGRDLGTILGPVDRAVWFADQRQVWFTAGIVWEIFDVRFGRTDETNEVRHGWTRHTIGVTGERSIRAVTLFPFGFNNSDPFLQPTFGGQISSGVNASYVWQRGVAGVVDGTFPTFLYRGTISTAAITLGDLLYNVAIYPPRLYGQPITPSVTATIQCVVSRNEAFSSENPQIADVTLTDTTMPIRTFEGINWSDGEVYRFRIGDAAPIAQRWQFNALLVPYQREEEAE